MDLEKNVPESEENLESTDVSQQQAENDVSNNNPEEPQAVEPAALEDEVDQEVVSSSESSVTNNESDSAPVDGEVIAEAEGGTDASAQVVSEEIQTKEGQEDAPSAEAVEAPEQAADINPEEVEKTNPAEPESLVSTSEGEGSSEDREDEEEHEEEEIDYEHLDKSELLELITSLSKEDDPKHFDKHLKPIKARFDDLFESERKVALDKFLEEGNEEGDFEYKGDETSVKFQDYYNLLRSKRANYYSGLEKRKQDNLKHKEEILERIRELIDGEESDASIKAVRDLQDEWKKVGPVPGQHNKTLWANYNALLDRFYDARSIYFELKDLDRKKNLDQKLEVCERAEKLDELENIKEAVIQLNELHEEFKHIGPVPRDQQEQIWLRFKAASDKIYVKRKDFVDHLKKSFDENLEKKVELAEKLEAFLTFDSDRISNWNKKTKEIQEIQRKWEAIGGVPRQQAKEINKRFWSAFKKFFANKSAFFKKFDSQREENLEKKRQLVQQAEELKESQDWQATTEAFKKLQSNWKEIGPVPEKFRNTIYEEFKAACDHFFNQRRAQNKEQEQSYEKNYEKKQVLCDQIEQLAKGSSINLEEVYELIDEYHDLGFVPRNVIKKAQTRFNEVTGMVMNSSNLSAEDQEDFRINIEVGRLKGGPHGGKKLFRKENALKRKIENLESDVNTWKTNMEFFASSKAADQLKKDFEEKIVKATEELQQLRKELRLIRS